MSSTDLALMTGAIKDLDDVSDALLERLETAGDGVVLLCDNSTSMLDAATTTSGPRTYTVRHHSRTEQRIMPRHAALCEALEPIRKLGRVIAFADQTRELGQSESMPEPGSTCGSGTDVARAIRHATKLNPARTILISDGSPNNADAAFEAAEQLPGILETIFVGDENDTRAKAFMREIATKCGGNFEDLSGQSAEPLATVLARYMLTR